MREYILRDKTKHIEATAAVNSLYKNQDDKNDNL